MCRVAAEGDRSLSVRDDEAAHNRIVAHDVGNAGERIGFLLQDRLTHRIQHQLDILQGSEGLVVDQVRERLRQLFSIGDRAGMGP